MLTENRGRGPARLRRQPESLYAGAAQCKTPYRHQSLEQTIAERALRAGTLRRHL